MAAGFRIETANIPAFAEAFENYARRTLSNEMPEQRLEIEALAGVRDIDQRLLRELSALEPFGEGNPRPVFATRSVRLISPPRRVGRANDHLQISIADSAGAAVRCVGFGMGHLEKKLLEADCFDIAYQPQQDNYNGRNGVQLLIEDIRFD
jgi:single-stranded-DNA-specific exonuclease